MASTSATILTALPPPDGCKSIDALAAETGLSKRKLASVIATLNRRGYVTVVRLGCYARSERGQALIASGKPMRSGPKGPTGPKPRRDTLRSRAWRALRSLKKATLPEILELACRGGEKDPETNIGPWLRALEAHGVVARLARREAGIALTSNGFLRWALIRDLGPAAPAWDRRAGCMYDPNNRCYLARQEGSQ